VNTKEIDLIKKLDSLAPEEVREIKPIVVNIEAGDYMVPVELAARLKGISRQAMYKAISEGRIRRYNGVLLSELVGYGVDREKQEIGRFSKQGKG